MRLTNSKQNGWARLQKGTAENRAVGGGAGLPCRQERGTSQWKNADADTEDGSTRNAEGEREDRGIKRRKRLQKLTRNRKNATP